jgi:predicted MFS family arabinose efflux permease
MPDGSTASADVGSGMNAPAARPAVAWAPLHRASYRAFWLASCCAYIGVWMQNVGAAWLMASLTSSPLRVAAVQWAVSLPAFLLGLPAGALADRLDRRRILLWSHGWTLAVSLGLGAMTLLGAIGPATLLLGTVLVGAGMALAMPAAQSAVADLVPRAELPQAIMLGGVAFNTARSLGPALAGVIIAAGGVGEVFVASGLACVGMLIVAARLRLPAVPVRRRRESLPAAIRTGVAYALRTRAVRAPLLRVAVFSLCAAALWALLPLMVHSASGGGGFGLLVASLGAGAVLSVFIAPTLIRWVGADSVSLGAGLLFAGAMGAAAHTAATALPWAWVMCAGVGWALSLNTSFAVMQADLPQWVRARCVALYMLVLQGGLALGSLLWGLAAEIIDVRSALSLAAASMAAGTLLTGWRYRRLPAPVH